VDLNFLEKRSINCPILVDHENAIDWNHVVTDPLESEVNSVLKNLDLLWPVPVLSTVMKQQDGPQVLRGQDDLVIMMAKPVIKHICDWPHKDVEKNFQESDEGSKEEANIHFMRTCTVCLGNDFSENHNCDGRDDDGHVAWNDLVQEDWESLQGKRVGKKKS